MMGFRRVDFVGHVVENGTVTMEINKLKKIQDVEPPTTKKQSESLHWPSLEVYPQFCRNCHLPYRSHKERSANESYLGTRTAACIQCSIESAERSPYTLPTGF